MGVKSPSVIDKHVGSRVRMRRMLIGMSQEKLGEALKITFQQVQKYEKGTNRISASRLQQIASVLGVTIDFFYEGATTDGTVAAPDATAVLLTQALASPEGLQLIRSFARISDHNVRQRLADLAEALSDGSKSNGEHPKKRGRAG
jgi:transcriptional regulator with XRE-family HTH domain